MVGGFDINLNNDNKIYMYTKKGTKVEITNSTAKKWLWTAAYYADEVRKNGAYNGDNPTPNVYRTCLSAYNALKSVSSTDADVNSSIAFFNAMFDGCLDSGYSPEYSDANIGQYKARLILFEGGGNQDLMATRGDPIPDITLQIKKVNEDGTIVLPGAKFRIYDSKRKRYVVESKKYTPDVEKAAIFTTGTNGLTEKLTVQQGTYVAVETTAPTGYIKLSGNISLSNNKVTTIKNEKTYKLVVNKIDTAGNSVKGAVFIFKNRGSDGYTRYVYYDVNAKKRTCKKYKTDSAESVQAEKDIIADYEANKSTYGFKTNAKGTLSVGITTVSPTLGTWYAKEIDAPEGYAISKTSWQKMTKASDSSQFTITATNKITQKGEIKILKNDQDGNALDGAKFTVYKLNSDGTRITPAIATDLETTNGQVTITDLDDATYEIVETQAPEDYIIVTESQKVTIKQDSKKQTVTFVNNKDTTPRQDTNYKSR